MSQESVYKILMQNKGKKFTRKQLAKKLNINCNTINVNVARLLKHNDIKQEPSKKRFNEQLIFIG